MIADMIVCVDDIGGISRNGKIPWRHREDMVHFRRMAKGKVCLFGRKTWDSILDTCKKYLEENAQVYVLSRTKPWETFVKFVHKYPDLPVLICGGQDIYQLAFDRANIQRLYITRIPGDYHCDRFFRFPQDYILEEETHWVGAKLQVYKSPLK